VRPRRSCGGPRFAGNSYLLGYPLLSNGDIVEWGRLEGDVSELFDVAVIPGVRWPIATGFLNDEVHRLYTFET
jgi:hypothetical protein